jgi:HEPN domain-containing protein
MGASDPVWNVTSFLAQQCAEKYLKAYLEERNIPYGKTHDLVVLLNSSAGSIPELNPYKQSLAQLSVFGVASRYPGAQVDQRAAQDSMKTAEHVRTVIRAKLQLP